MPGPARAASAPGELQGAQTRPTGLRSAPRRPSRLCAEAKALGPQEFNEPPDAAPLGWVGSRWRRGTRSPPAGTQGEGLAGRRAQKGSRPGGGCRGLESCLEALSWGRREPWKVMEWDGHGGTSIRRSLHLPACAGWGGERGPIQVRRVAGPRLEEAELLPQSRKSQSLNFYQGPPMSQA